jgi:predicted RNase H-like nuclease (RuvC/YqgF family)
MGRLIHAGEAVQRVFVRHMPPEMLADRDDIGPASSGEIEHIRARNEQLETENARLRRENLALQSKIEELKAKLLDIPAFLDRTREAAS